MTTETSEKGGLWSESWRMGGLRQAASWVASSVTGGPRLGAVWLTLPNPGSRRKSRWSNPSSMTSLVSGWTRKVRLNASCVILLVILGGLLLQWPSLCSCGLWTFLHEGDAVHNGRPWTMRVWLRVHTFRLFSFDPCHSVDLGSSNPGRARVSLLLAICACGGPT